MNDKDGSATEREFDENKHPVILYWSFYGLRYK